jgi:hypothetical protein
VWDSYVKERDETGPDCLSYDDAEKFSVSPGKLLKMVVWLVSPSQREMRETTLGF